MCNETTREVWMPVLGYDGLYEVSNLGAIRRDRGAPARSLGVPGRTLQPTTEATGYVVVSLSRHGEVRKHRLNRVVLEAFCGPAPFDGAQAAHNDGDPTRNALTNLRWATPIENQADVDRHGRRCRGENVHGARLAEGDVREIRRLFRTGRSNPEIAGVFGVSPSTIHLIRHNRTWRHVA